MPDEAPVIHTSLFIQFGFTVLLRMKATSAYKINSPIMDMMIIDKYIYSILSRKNQEQVIQNLSEDFNQSTQLYLPLFKYFYTETMQKIMKKQSFANGRSVYVVAQSWRHTTKAEGVNAERFSNTNNSFLMRTSPRNDNSRTKIRLVSPFKSAHAGDKLKQNNPPAVSKTSDGFYSAINQRPPLEIELGGKKATSEAAKYAIQNDSYLSINHHMNRESTQSFALPVRDPFKHAPHHAMQSVVGISTPTFKAVSPSKICINNKSFDIGSIKSKVVFVAPLTHKSQTTPPQSIQYRTHTPISNVQSIACTKQAFLQEWNSKQNAKQSHESQLQQIKQLQKQIEENNIQIKELLKSNSNKHPDDSRVSIIHQKFPQIITENSPVYDCPINPSMETRQTLINELSCIKGKRSESLRDEISVQTDIIQYSGILEHSVEKNQSKCSKFAITRNNQCQIKVASLQMQVQQCSRATEENQYTFAQDADEKSVKGVAQSRPSLNNVTQAYNNKIENSIRKPQQEIQQQIVPVSFQPEYMVIPYDVNINLKSSRADSENSIIEYSRSVIDYQESIKEIASKIEVQPIKSVPSLPILAPKQILNPTILTNIEPSSQTIFKVPPKQEKIQSASPISSSQIRANTLSGKRRINNSIYL